VNPNYIAFILAYDYCNEFEALDLACDEAFELAEEIASRYLKHRENIYLSEYNMPEYELLMEYCDSISFREVWKVMHPDWDFRWRYKE
jgi:hypothetical protein